MLTRMAEMKKRPTIPNADKDGEHLEPSYIADGHTKWYSHSGKQIGSFL